MLYGYSVDADAAAENADEVPNIENEFANAKTFLQTASKNTGDNLYDHLTEVLNKILAERPENIIDFFEEYSRKVKEQRFRPLTDHLEDMYISPPIHDLAKKMLLCLKPLPEKPPSTVDPDDLETVDMSRNNMLEMLFYLEQAGLGLPRKEMVFIMLSMRNLVEQRPIATIKFWGKITGRLYNYLVLETELKEDEYMKRNQKVNEDQAAAEMAALEMQANVDPVVKALQDISKQQEQEGEGGPKSKVPRTLPAAPQIQAPLQREPPSEQCGIGLNRKVYYVCTEIGGDWVELPDVTPKQLRVARQIYKTFTGNLQTEICTYPEFPGNEMNLLRAQITRISSGTQIAPLGFYTFGGAEELGEGAEEDEVGEEMAGGETKTVYTVNKNYEPPAMKDLLDKSMSFWVHTSPYILPQGRVTWWNPGPEQEQDVEDEELGEQMAEEEEEEDKKVEKFEPETGPPLLTPLSEDASLETTNPWNVRSTSNYIGMYPLAVVRSNLWPGGYAMCTPNKSFYNIYLGLGLKYMQNNFSPLPLPQVQQEYPVGPEILEMLDPTGAEEEKWRVDHLPKPKPIPGEGGEEAEPEQLGEEEEDEEDEEDD